MKKSNLKFFVSFAILALSSNMAHPVTPMYIAERGIDSPMFGYAFSGAMLTMFLTSPLYGKLCNYMATKKLLTITTFGYALGQFFFFLAQSNLTMLLARVFAGLFAGGMWTAALNYTINTSENADDRAKNLTTYVTIQSVVSALGYFLGGMLGEIRTEVALISQVVMILVSCVMFTLLCSDDSSLIEKDAQPLKLRDVNPFGAFVDVKKYATGLLVLLFVITAITNIGQSTFEQEFNYYIMDHFKLTSGYNGGFKAAIALVSFVANVTLSMRIQRKTNINLSSLPIIIACTLPLGLILLFDNVIPFAIMDIAFYGFNALRTPVLQNLITSNTDRASSNNAMGFYQAMIYLGSLFGGLFAGMLFTIENKLPFTVAFLSFVLAAIITVIYVIKYKKKNPGSKMFERPHIKELIR